MRGLWANRSDPSWLSHRCRRTPSPWASDRGLLLPVRKPNCLRTNEPTWLRVGKGAIWRSALLFYFVGEWLENKPLGLAPAEIIAEIPAKPEKRSKLCC